MPANSGVNFPIGSYNSHFFVWAASTAHPGQTGPDCGTAAVYSILDLRQQACLSV